MSPVEDIISSLLSAGGIPDPIISRILIEGSGNSLREIAALDVNEPFESDVYGLISSNVQSTTKRRMLTSSFPPIQLGMLSDSFFAWLKTLSECRCRPVRSAASLASFFVVEQAVKKFKSANRVEEFCGKVCREILIPRCRDTCSVIRQMGAEYIGRWYRLRPVQEPLFFATIGDLMVDDESIVRMEIIKALQSLQELHQFIVTPDLGRVLIKAFFVRCEEVHEDHQPSSGKKKEIILHAALLRQVLFKQPSNLLIDSLGEEVECLYQVLWDRPVPLEARTSIAEIVSKQVMGEDILCSTGMWIEEDKVYDIIEAFINEFNPWIDEDQQCGRRFHHVGVWEAFISSYHETPLKLDSFMRLAVCKINIDLIEAISCQVLLHRLTSFTFLGAENIFKDQRLLFDIRIIDSVHRLAKSTTSSTSLNTSSPELIVNSLSALVTSSKCSYSLKYLVYRLWHTLAASNHTLALALSQWTIICDDVKNLENVHAFEAAVPRPVVDLSHVRDLLHFINSGLKEMISLPSLVCALDLAIMRFLTLQNAQQIPACSVLELKAELESTLQSIILRGDSRVHKLLSSFCKYRLKALENPNITLENKHKRLVEIRDTRHMWEGVPASTYIISSLIEQESIDASILAYME